VRQLKIFENPSMFEKLATKISAYILPRARCIFCHAVIRDKIRGSWFLQVGI